MSQKIILFSLLCAATFSLNARRAMEQKEVKQAVKIYSMPQDHKTKAPLVFSWEQKTISSKNAKKEFNKLIQTPIKTMTEEQLRKAANLALSLGLYEDALRYLEHLLKETKNLVTAKTLRLEIADVNFDRGALKKAAEQYAEFLSLYPGDKHAEYAQYKAILSNYYTIPIAADRDQSATHATISLANQFLKENKLYAQYKQQVVDLRLSCYEKLFKHESIVFDYYLAQKKPKAAETRLADLRKNYSHILPKKEAENLFMEYRLARLTKNHERENRTLARLAKEFPQAEITRTAFAQQKPLNKKDYVVVF